MRKRLALLLGLALAITGGLVASALSASPPPAGTVKKAAPILSPVASLDGEHFSATSLNDGNVSCGQNGDGTFWIDVNGDASGPVYNGTFREKITFKIDGHSGPSRLESMYAKFRIFAQDGNSNPYEIDGWKKQKDEFTGATDEVTGETNDEAGDTSHGSGNTNKVDCNSIPNQAFGDFDNAQYGVEIRSLIGGGDWKDKGDTSGEAYFDTTPQAFLFENFLSDNGPDAQPDGGPFGSTLVG